MNRVSHIGAASGKIEVHRRRHKHRRFHRPREALGHGFEKYGVEPAAPISTPAASPADSEPAELEQPEVKQQRISRRGIRWCTLALVAVLLVYHYKWVWQLYLSAMRAWPDLHWR